MLLSARTITYLNATSNCLAINLHNNFIVIKRVLEDAGMQFLEHGKIAVGAGVALKEELNES